MQITAFEWELVGDNSWFVVNLWLSDGEEGKTWRIANGCMYIDFGRGWQPVAHKVVTK